MSSDRHARVKTLFLAVCALPPAERSAYLDDACSDDAELREELENLLGFHDGEATGLIDADAVPSTEMPERIGSFRILRKLGEGGMGEVYEAEQTEPVRRRIALKVIKWGMDTKEVVARFSSERQALALMDHPSIAKVYEAGSTEQGRPYIAMEYVRGVPITDYCDTHRLTTRERLQLFIRVCHGVQHAHQRGVIHRDIKPSNVLVAVPDQLPVPKIIDFGVAKATSQRLTEQTVFTELGQWIGTPEYMSPEQAEMTGLDIDTRTDVYSLGVILYELLVGAQPFDPKSLRTGGFDEMRRRIREEEPPRPSTRVSSLGHEDSDVAADKRRTDRSTLVRQLRGDLDWIVMKSLEKDRTRRYGSPADSAADVQRFLDDEPVLARPPSTAYRLGKFVRRHRVAVAAGSLVLAALVAGIVGTSIGLVRAKREAETARRVAEFTVGIFSELNPGAIRGGAASPETILDRGVERIEAQLAGEPLVQAELMVTTGLAYTYLDRMETAKPLLERALAIREQRLGPGHLETARAASALAWWRYQSGDYRGALELDRQALGIFERELGAEHPSITDGLRNVGRVHWMLGDMDQAKAHFNRAIAILDLPAKPYDLALAQVLHWRGIAATDLGDYRAAIADLERGVDILERLLGANHPELGWALHDLGRPNSLLRENERAEALFRRSLQIFESTLGSDHRGVAFAASGLADTLRRVGRYDEARPLYERALAIREQQLGPVHIEVQWTLQGYGWLLIRQGETDAGLETYRRALEIVREVLPAGHAEEGWCLIGVGAAERLTGDFDSAREHLRAGLDVIERARGSDYASLGSGLLYLALAERDLGNLERARQHLERAIALRTAAGQLRHNNLAESHLELAEVERRTGNLEAGVRNYERSLELFTDAYGVGSPFTVEAQRRYDEYRRVTGAP